MNGRSPASSGPWRRSIAARAFRTKRSRTGLIHGAASASGRLLNDRRHEHRLVAGGDPRPDFAENLHRRGEPRRGAADCVAHPPRRRTLIAGQPAYGTARPRARHPRTRHSTDALYRALPHARRVHTDFARLSRRAALAGQLLAFPVFLYLAQNMHAVERIAAAMDVAGASINLGRQCRFSASDTSRPIAIISRSHSASTG